MGAIQTFDREARLSIGIIARASGQSRHQVRRRLEGTASAGRAGVGGPPAVLYTLADIPRDMRESVAAYDLSPLAAMIGSWADKRCPTKSEAARLLDAAFLHLKNATAQGANERVIKAYQIAWLRDHAPGLASSGPALRKAYNRALRRWEKSGRKLAALFDQRPKQNRLRRAPQLPKDDCDLLVATAISRHEGRLLPAWRECHDNLTKETQRRYPGRHEVPVKVRRQVMPEVRRLLPYHIGPRSARLNGCSHERDWSHVFAGDWFQSDDLTLPVYFYLPERPQELLRGQFLPMIDLKSERVLDFVLVPENTYTAADIRGLIAKVGARYGLPREGYHFECGIWKRAKLVGGRTPNGPGDDFGETFADRLGLRIMHAIPGNARSKLIERVGGILQDLMACEPGYVGRDEMHVKYERVQRAIRDVNSGRAHPGEVGFFSFDEWFARLGQICEAYNLTARESEVMGGRMSPDEAWERCQRRLPDGSIDPVAKLPPELSYLLAAHREIVTVGRNGISLFGGKYRYVSEVTGARRGESVVCWFDPADPDLLTITGLHGDRMEVVPRCPKVRAMDGYEVEPDKMRLANGLVSAHNAYASRRYSELRTRFFPPTRSTIADPATLERGREMERLRARIAQARRNKSESELQKEEAERMEEFNRRLADLRKWEEEHRWEFI